jgi:hypothetical protein
MRSLGTARPTGDSFPESESNTSPPADQTSEFPLGCRPYLTRQRCASTGPTEKADHAGCIFGRKLILELTHGCLSIYAALSFPDSYDANY